MASTGAQFYAENAEVYLAATNGWSSREYPIGLAAQASILYKSRLSTKCASAELKFRTKHTTKRIKDVKKLIRDYKLKDEAPKAVHSKQVSSRTMTVVVRERTDGLHNSQVGSFILEVMDLKFGRYSEAGNLIAAFEKFSGKSTPAPRLSATIKRKSQDILANIHKKQKLQHCRPPAEEDSESPSIPEHQFECNPLNCRHIAKPDKEHKALHLLEMTADAEISKSREANLKRCELLRRDYIMIKMEAYTGSADVFNALPGKVQGAWILLRQNASRYQCKTLPSINCAELISNRDLTEYRIQQDKIKLEELMLTAQPKLAEEALSKHKADLETKATLEEFMQTVPNSMCRSNMDDEERVSFGWAQRWLASNKQPSLGDTELVAIQRKFIYRRADLDPNAIVHDELWKKSKIHTIWAGPVRDDARTGVNALFHATAFVKAKKEHMAGVRVIEGAIRREERTAARLQECWKNEVKRLEALKAKAPKRKRKFPPTPPPPTKSPILEIEPLSAVPQQMSRYMKPTLTKGLNLSGVIDQVTGNTLIDDGTKNFIVGDPNNNRTRVFGPNGDMVSRNNNGSGSGSWTPSHIWNSGRKAPVLKRSSCLRNEVKL